MSRLGADTNPHPATMNGWQVEASPANAGSAHPSTVRVFARSLRRSTLRPAGFVAVAGQMSSYLTAAKVGAVIARAGNGTAPGFRVTTNDFSVDVLPEDGPALIAALCAVLQSSLNVSDA